MSYRRSSSGSAQARAMLTRPVAILIVLCTLLLAACACLAVLLVHVLNRPRESQLCLTQHCITSASTLLASMDQSVDPCEDFYNYACGHWIENNPIPDDASSVTNFDNLNKMLEMNLKELLGGEHLKPDQSEAVQKARAFYAMCLDEELIGDTMYAAIDNSTWRSFLGWPSIHKDWKEEKLEEEPFEVIYARIVRQYQANYLFKVSVQPDDKNSSIHVLLLDSPEFNFFGRQFYLVPDMKEDRLAYRELMAEALVLLGSDNATATKDAKSILEMEIKLAEITLPEHLRHDLQELYFKTTLGDLQDSQENFNWRLFFKELYVEMPEKQKLFTNDVDIVIYGKDYFKEFDKFIGSVDKRTLMNYLAWSWFFRSVIRDLPDPFAIVIFKFHRKLNLAKAPKPRWHDCVKRVNPLMPMATSRMYVNAHFDEQAKHKVEEMIGLIMEELRHTLRDEEWLTESTKAVAMEKIDAMSQKIGFPDVVLEPADVDKLYENYSVLENNYLQTKFNFLEQQQHDFLVKLNEEVDRSKWVTGAAVVNAFYSPNTNEILFPAGILQPVFYDMNYPDSMNFGGIGVVIGHEIIHGFDDRGRLYDKLGNVREWWDAETIMRFKEKAKCIEDQYSDYLFDQVNMTINGKKTNGENIADNGGLKHAYLAYKRKKSISPPVQLIPGLNLTHDQLFFLNYAQIWCGHMNDKEAVRKIRTSEHCPGLIRVKGPLSNSEEFAEAYNCKVGSGMNPENKCKVW